LAENQPKFLRKFSPKAAAESGLFDGEIQRSAAAFRTPKKTDQKWKWLSNLLNFKLGSISLWLLLPLAAAAADVIEDACHFQYLKLHARDRSPGHLLTIFSCTMSWVKGICFVAAIILTLAGILQAAWLCAIQPEKFGWRGIPAVLVFLSGAAMLVALLVVPRFYQLVNKHAFGKTTNGRS